MSSLRESDLIVSSYWPCMQIQVAVSASCCLIFESYLWAIALPYFGDHVEHVFFQVFLTTGIQLLIPIIHSEAFLYISVTITNHLNISYCQISLMPNFSSILRLWDKYCYGNWLMQCTHQLQLQILHDRLRTFAINGRVMMQTVMQGCRMFVLNTICLTF